MRKRTEGLGLTRGKDDVERPWGGKRGRTSAMFDEKGVALYEVNKPVASGNCHKVYLTHEEIQKLIFEYMQWREP